VARRPQQPPVVYLFIELTRGLIYHSINNVQQGAARRAKGLYSTCARASLPCMLRADAFVGGGRPEDMAGPRARRRWGRAPTWPDKRGPGSLWRRSGERRGTVRPLAAWRGARRPPRTRRNPVPPGAASACGAWSPAAVPGEFRLGRQPLATTMQLSVSARWSCAGRAAAHACNQRNAKRVSLSIKRLKKWINF